MVDIFTANHYITGAPLNGIGFITKNLYPLLDKYKIKYEKKTYSEEDIFKDQLAMVYREVLNLLISDAACTSFDLAKERGWTEKTCHQLGIATVVDFDTFVQQLSGRTGLSKDALVTQYGIWPRIFAKDKITFTICTVTGQPSHFWARNVGWKKGKGQKYDSSPANCRLDQDALFGLHLAKRYISQRLDIFEGHPDVATAMQAGLNCCCALGGLNFTPGHVEMIKELGFTSVCFVLDQDSPGRTRMKSMLAQFGTSTNIEVSVLHLKLSKEEAADSRTNDPDYFIRKYGLEAYRKLEPKKAFDYRLEEYTNSQGAQTQTQFLQSVMPLLLGTANRIERGRMIKKLARATGIEVDDIKDEVERLERADVSNLVYRLSKDLYSVRDAEELSALISDVQAKLSSTAIGREERKKLSVAECMENYRHILESLRTRSTGIHGWTTGFEFFDKYVDGIPKPTNGGSLLALAGSPHVGKSALLLAIAYNVARLNKDVTVLYWAIDDARKDIYPRLLAALTGVSIAKIARIVPFVGGEEKRVTAAEEELAHLIEEGRFQVKDDEVGRQRALASKWIQDSWTRYERPILLAVDSFHNIIFGGKAESDERVKAKALSVWLKSASRKENFTVICTMELNKSGFERPTLASINETGKVVYDWDFIGFVNNRFLATRSPDDPHWVKGTQLMPIIELDIQKNKLGRRGSLWYQLDEDTTGLVEVDPSKMGTGIRDYAEEVERRYNRTLGKDKGEDLFT